MGKLEEMFEQMHKNPPPPFNDNYDPKAAARSKQAIQSMEDDGYYDDHTREECATEIKRRTDKLKEEQ